MNILDTLLLKLGYRPTHWTDTTIRDMLEIMIEATISPVEKRTFKKEGYKVTLSVKKMKHGTTK